MAAQRRRKLHTKLILDVSLTFAVVVLLYIVVNFYYERKLTSDALLAKFRGNVVARPVQTQRPPSRAFSQFRFAVNRAVVAIARNVFDACDVDFVQ